MKNKNKKNRGILIALIAIIALGVGYAAITGDPLNINGSAHLDDFVVVFDENHTPVISDNSGVDKIAAYSVTSGQDTIETTADYTDKYNATFDLYGFKRVGDIAYVVYKIDNKSLTYDASLALASNVTAIPAAGTNYFTITYAYDNSASANVNSLTFVATPTTTITKSTSSTTTSEYLYVKVALTSEPQGGFDGSEGVTVTTTITPTAITN